MATVISGTGRPPAQPGQPQALPTATGAPIENEFTHELHPCEHSVTFPSRESGMMRRNFITQWSSRMRQGSMALIGKIFRKDSASWLVIDEAREAGKLNVRRIDGQRTLVQMTATEVAQNLERRIA
ncbi:MAG: hypothetical protein R3E84_11270 [Pseudomonadales bacterium]